MRILLIVTIAILAYACKSKQPKMGEGLFEQRALEFSKEQTSYKIYDSITPPKLLIDTTAFYEKLIRQLRFLDSIKWDGSPSFAFIAAHVTEMGDFHIDRFEHPEEKRNETYSLATFVEQHCIHWQPASLKKKPNTKVSYALRIRISVYEDKILFNFGDYYDLTLLKKDFNRPLPI